MSNILIQESPQVMVGLGTMTFTASTAGLMNVKSQMTVTPTPGSGDGAGSGTGLGSGTGGGGEGFTSGDLGLGHGGVGQGFGPGNGYQQPPAYGSNESSVAGSASGLSVVVNKNGSPIYTSPAFAGHDFTFQFKTNVLVAINDVITVVYASSNAQDQMLNTVKSSTSIGSGIN